MECWDAGETELQSERFGGAGRQVGEVRHTLGFKPHMDQLPGHVHGQLAPANDDTAHEQMHETPRPRQDKDATFGNTDFVCKCWRVD
jgi:hypothetical protein